MIYAGGCHCKKIRYTVDTTFTGGFTCNCSICSKKGHVLAMASIESFKLLNGQESLSSYVFNKKVIQHFFCKNCGIGVFGKGTGQDGKEAVAVNIRTLDDYENINIPLSQVNGKAF